MTRTKIAITLDEKTLAQIDQLVKKQTYPNRSQAIQEALDEKLNRLTHSRLARVCAKLDPAMEQRLAEEGLTEEVTAWPEY